jgi:DNA-binding GntR family transcriptional regulator
MKSVNTDVAYEYVRKKILSGEYAPGKSLLTEVLANEIKVSRTPVRDALRKLEADGLVTIRAHLGASVKQMQLKEFREMCDLRLALEVHAAGLAALNHSETNLREIEYALEAMRRLTEEVIHAPQEQPLLGELVREDVRFHISIISAAKNDLIMKEILRLHLINRVQVVLTPPGKAPKAKIESEARRRSIQAKHDAIYAAIAGSDALGAKKEMESHLQEWIDHTMLLMTRAETGVLARELTPDELAYNS